MTRKRIKADNCYLEGPDDDLAGDFSERWIGRYWIAQAPNGERLYEFQTPEPRRIFNGLPVFEWNRVTDPDVLARFKVPPWHDETPEPEPCKRCGSTNERGDGAALLAANPTLREPSGGDTFCAQCLGHSMQNIIDMAWKLDAIPTDALMRELARRFL